MILKNQFVKLGEELERVIRNHYFRAKDLGFLGISEFSKFRTKN